MDKFKENFVSNKMGNTSQEQENQNLTKFSLFKRPILNTIPFSTTNTLDIYNLIKGLKYQDITQRLRSISDKNEARQYKADHFDYACFSGEFTKRSNKSLIKHSELMVLDFDHLTDLEHIKTKLINDIHLETELLFISPSGDGLKWVVKIDLSKANHHDYFIGIKNYLKFTYGIDIDDSGKDVARACFLPHDKDVFINSNASESQKEFNPHIWQNEQKNIMASLKFDCLEEDVDKLINVIETTRIDITQGYENWMKIGFAIIDLFGESGRSNFHRISQFYSKYDSYNCNEFFDGLLKSNGSGITINSLFWLAKEHGIVINSVIDKQIQSKIKKAVPGKLKSKPFPVDAFPNTIAEFVSKSAEAINCPEEFIAVPMLSCFAMAMSNKRVVELKKDWREFAILYAAIVSRPGTKKSPALNKAILPLKQLQNKFSASYLKDKEKYQKKCEAFESEFQRWKSLSKSERLNSETPIKPDTPTVKQLITSDATMEAITELMINNNSGVLCYMDELAGWIKGMNQYKSGGGNELEMWLKLWSAIFQIINRKGKEPIFSDNPFVNVLGGIQPEVLDIFSGKDNGLIDRILFAYPDEIAPMITDIEVSEILDEKLTSIFNRLFNAHFKEGVKSDQPEITRFSSEAYQKFKDYVNNTLYKEMVSYQMPYYLRGAWAKFPGYIARFALIIQGMNYGENKKTLEKIDLDSLNKAIEITEYFMENAKKVYARLNASKVDRKVELAERWINRNGGNASLREIYTHKVAGCKNTKQAKSLFEEMVNRELGIMNEHYPEGGGRATFIFVLDDAVSNPRELNYNFD
ncbi:DUF3987 domain-containing protein [Ancylomarina sp. 16SWW S1-10-2]|uniref:DUF3987 domain-containing protein n=1 Tax=Ancylomarina sp. 16SWW S1-10-2 TaxID=2499681 RepID=UPI0012AEA986|nr:DUF3987 domain-containing protein [Ancylomarina sp. 16SWW S1-10-2]MRT91910.1 DUF3987 domain-containing protein [Ancylomarina sp. 16SWW S1-10-2]